MYNPPFLVQDPSSWNITNLAWEITNFNISSFIYVQPSGNYTRFQYSMTLQRKGGTVLVAVMIPGALITFLGLVYVLLDKGTGERTAFLSTILLTEVMFLVMITNLVPLSHNVPYLGWLFLAYVIQLTFMTLVIIVIEKLYQKFVIQEEQEDHHCEDE